MKKRIILLLAALTALLSCAEIGNEYDNPWDKRGSNYCPPTQAGCPGYVDPWCPSTRPECPGYVDPCIANPTPGCPGYVPPNTGNNFTVTVGGVEFSMVYVSGWTFEMGCTEEQGSDCYSDENPKHNVTLSDYYVGRYEVTQGLWKAVMGSNPSSDCGSYGIGDNYPVYCVSWNQVQTFITALNDMTEKNYRLPTEAEWEFAARGGNSSQGYKYSGSNTIGDVAWYSGNSGSSTHIVGTKVPNELGIYDMSGNVWEWVNDWYGSYSNGAQTDPIGPSSGSFRVIRGGSWRYGAGICRVSFRNNNYPDYRNSDLGFRLAVSP
jgi:formylglycine-generating enzyme required for sulfatase activity